MRPKKRILLVGASEDRVGVLRFLLFTKGFAACGVLTAAEALGALRAARFNLLLVDLPLAGAEFLLDRAHAEDNSLPTLCLVSQGGAHPESCSSYGLIPWQSFSPENLIERVKILTARKRGPKPLRKPVGSAEVLSETLEVRRTA
jgi:hypothetical protein